MKPDTEPLRWGLVCTALIGLPAAASCSGEAVHSDAARSDGGTRPDAALDVDTGADVGLDAVADADGSDGEAGTGGSTLSPGLDLEPLEASLATEAQWLTKAASSSAGTGILWSDSRASTTHYVARLEADGSLFDPLGIRVGTEATDEADIAASEEGYLIVWSPQTGACYGPGIRAAFLPAGGGGLGPALVLESPHEYCLDTARVAYDGDRFVVVWRARKPASGYGGAPNQSEERTHGVRLDALGNPIDPAPVVLDGVSSGRMAGSPDGVLLTWLDEHLFDTALLRTENGLSVVPTTGGGHASAAEPRPARGGGSYLVAWPGLQGILAVRLDGDGAPLDGTPLVLGSAASTDPDFRPVFSGGEFRVSWEAGDESAGYHTKTASVSPGGVVSAAQVAAADTRSLEWLEGGSTPRAVGTTAGEIPRLFVAEGSVPLQPEPLVEVANAQWELSMAPTEGGAFAAWLDKRTDERRVVVSKLTASATAHQAWWTIVATMGAGHGRVAPAVAAVEGRACVAWFESDLGSLTTRVLARRVGASGELLDTAPIEVGVQTMTAQGSQPFPCQSTLATAPGDDGYLAVYNIDWCNAYPNQNVCAAYVDEGGGVTDVGCTYGRAPTVASGGDSFLVAWTRATAGVSRVHARWIEPSGTLEGDTTVVSDEAVNDSAFGVRAAVSGDAALVVWMIQKHDANHELIREVHAALLQEGVIAKPAFLVAAGADAEGVQVASDDEGFWVAWVDRAGAPSVRATRVSPTGGIPSDPVVVFEDVLLDSSPALAPLDPSRVLVGASMLEDSLGSARVKVRALSLTH